MMCCRWWCNANDGAWVILMLICTDINIEMETYDVGIKLEKLDVILEF